MRIKTLRVNNFKSLVDFHLDLARFSCLIGLNGSGKSTVLQFVDFMAQQVLGDVARWLDERHWKPRDIASRFSPRANIEFEVTLVTDDGEGGVSWKASFNVSRKRCVSERIDTPGATLVVQDRHLHVFERAEAHGPTTDLVKGPISFRYEGSILSQLQEQGLPLPLIEFKNYVAGIGSLDLLSPEYLRRRARESDGTIGLAGQGLSAFLHEIGPERKSRLTDQLKQVYPLLESLRTRSLRSGWKQLEIQETYDPVRLVTEARHINDGMLRLIAILAELQGERRFLLFDEIENGINPELVEFVLDALVSARQQVMVTTHSPMILNYMDDDIARAGVLYLYKTSAGHTRSIPFFSIPSLAEKLNVMGPGEALVDTDLTALSEEISRLKGGQ